MLIELTDTFIAGQFERKNIIITEYQFIKSGSMQGNPDCSF